MATKLTTLAQLRNLSQRVHGLVADLANATVEALEEFAASKADKPAFLSVTIPISGWAATEDAEFLAAGYAYFCKVDISTATAADGAKTDLSPDSLSPAAACGLCQTCKVINGSIRYYAVSVPEKNLTAQVQLIK